MAVITDEADGIGRVLRGVAGETNSLAGLDGNDTLFGAELTDVILAGTGFDQIFGGGGADRVILEHDAFNGTGFGADRWIDFDAAELDRIDVSDTGQGSSSGGAIGIGEIETIKAMMFYVFTSGGTYVEIQWGTSRLSLEGVSNIADLGSSNFVFNQSNTADVFTLGSGNSILALSGGHDFVDGEAGNDTLFGEQGKDTVLGGSGNDMVFGGSGNDTLFGDAGADTINGGSGADEIVAGTGNDTILGGLGADRVKLSHDALTGAGHGTETWRDFALVQGDKVDVSNLGGSGLSTFNFGIGEMATVLAMAAVAPSGGRGMNWGSTRIDLDTVTGLTAAMFTFNRTDIGQSVSFGAMGNIAAMALGDDTMNGGGGADTLFGEQGDDSLLGGSGGDALFGGSGNDGVAGGADADLLFGGTGADTLEGAAAADTLHGDAGRDVLFGGAADDVLSGGREGDTLDGGAGGDTMTGGDGDDLYYVNQAPYPLDPFDSYDRCVELNGTAGGIDRVIVSAREYTLEANIENATVIAKIGGEYLGFGLPILLLGNEADNQLTGSTTQRGARQVIDGEGGDDTINGLGGIDELFGGKGADVIDGGSGNDLVMGGRGLDMLSGGLGRDTLSGDTDFDFVDGRLVDLTAPSEDRFVFDTAAGREDADLIADFDSRDFIILDRSVFTSLTGDSGRAIARGNFVLGSEARDANDFILYDADNGALWYDADGNGGGAKQLICNIYSGSRPEVREVPVSFTAPYGIEISYKFIAAAGIDNFDILLL